MTTTTTTTCPPIACLNNGKFSTVTCSCLCLPTYTGKSCETGKLMSYLIIADTLFFKF